MPEAFGKIEHPERGIVGVDRPGIGPGDLDGAGDDSRQHRIEVERGRDGAPDLLEPLELAHGLGEIAGAFFHLVLQARIGFLELGGHPVELVGEVLDLVLGVDLDAVVELAGGEPPGAGLQLVDRHHHVSRQEHPGDDGERETQSQQPADPDQEAVDRRDRLVERLLEKHEQIDARDGGGPDENLMPAGILADRGRLGAGDHGGNLGQAGEIGPEPPVRRRNSRAGGPAVPRYRHIRACRRLARSRIRRGISG